MKKHVLAIAAIDNDDTVATIDNDDGVVVDIAINNGTTMQVKSVLVT
jgi:hypothetical protein